MKSTLFYILYHFRYLQSKCACCLKGTCKRQRGGCQTKQCETTPNNAILKQHASKVMWNSSSQGSASISPDSTDSNNFEWYVYEVSIAYPGEIILGNFLSFFACILPLTIKSFTTLKFKN